MAHSKQNTAYHMFQTELGQHLFLVNGSQVYDIEKAFAEQLLQARPDGVAQLLRDAGLEQPAYISDHALSTHPIHALSLAVAQKCNLGCSYCYADGGGFGSTPQMMSWTVAQPAIDQLLAATPAGERVTLAFMGGEPLANRALLQQATRYLQAQAQAREIQAGFAITTNGSLLTAADVDFFAEYGFAVNVSLDGVGAVHDRLRPFKGGQGSYAHIMQRVQPLLARQNPMQVSARVTVTPYNLEILDTLDTFIKQGFHSVGFAPMLSASSGFGELAHDDLQALLTTMQQAGEVFVQHTVAGQRYPFSNLTTALASIHRGTHRPYPCGAGAGYLGVSAQGELSACHRFVDDPAGAMGHVKTGGVDRDQQRMWLAQRHVHQQTPCMQCWARYLCGGGCYHEVLHRGRPACDYIRGWLTYCLQVYVRLQVTCPDYFTHLTPTLHE